ncbi:MAG: alpha/beta hydrolase [Glaciihabitans sp.]|jgi:acetyl esterase/lipase|nr:alpha/beta hydrolase [Glaciihabitans sp.]MDQ1570170.1 hypothetical protein [Actinomycetota bacterium]
MTRSHVLVLPGGGYSHHAPHEGEPIAAWLRGLGLDASVLLYPVKTRYPAALQVIRAEIRRLRSTGIERVALIGFSAGGHAAGLAALADGAAMDEGVDAVILGYPVVSMLLESHRGSREQLIGPDASTSLRVKTSLDQLVTASAPPFFIWHTAEDASVPVQHSYLLGMALAADGVPHSLHVFPRGEHGIGLATDRGTAAEWPALCEAWLRELGWL